MGFVKKTPMKILREMHRENPEHVRPWDIDCICDIPHWKTYSTVIIYGIVPYLLSCGPLRRNSLPEA